MWFNSKQREEPYQVLTSSDNLEIGRPFGGRVTGGAWLSSARVVRCWVKSNEAQPLILVASIQLGTLVTAGDKPEEGGDDVKSSCPYDLGYTCRMDRTKGSETARLSQSHKSVLSSDRSLQLDCVKLESLVIADQHAAVNTSRPCTARHTTRVCNRSR